MFIESPGPTAVCGEDCAVGIVFKLPESAAHVHYLRQKARGLLENLDVSRNDTDDIETIVCELATNATRHAHGGSYQVHIDLHSNQVVIEVIDQGIGFDPSLLPEPGSERSDTLASDVFERIGGFGLPLVRCLSDHVEIVPNAARGMTVRAIKSLQPKL